MGAISLPYTRKLLVYTFDGHSRGGGVPPSPEGFVYTCIYCIYCIYAANRIYRSDVYTLLLTLYTLGNLYTRLAKFTRSNRRINLQKPRKFAHLNRHKCIGGAQFAHFAGPRTPHPYTTYAQENKSKEAILTIKSSIIANSDFKEDDFIIEV